MKKEEFEWLKKWLNMVQGAYFGHGKGFREAMDEASKKYPPPIDEEKIKGPTGNPRRAPLSWGAYEIYSDAVVLDGAIVPEGHGGHIVDLLIQHRPCCDSDHSFGVVVLCRNCNNEILKTNSQFLHKIEEEPK